MKEKFNLTFSEYSDILEKIDKHSLEMYDLLDQDKKERFLDRIQDRIKRDNCEKEDCWGYKYSKLRSLCNICDVLIDHFYTY